ncbi:MAG: malto-oligosyltrehalose synthase [Chloroflexota bacterium]|nr:malto-oligosyltrehalose synthase [Chloroflexota bacterium]
MSVTNAATGTVIGNRGRAVWIPESTYRVQVSKDFTFTDAARIVPYLAKLGIGALYVSPFFKATPGSTHGYDVTDYLELNPELGGDAAYQELVGALHRHDIGLLIDFVPNHMGISGGRNRWWQDVLENGAASPAKTYFDIDWTPLKRELREKVLLPILGDQYGEVLERGELVLQLADGAFHVQYFETPLPIAPPTYPIILRHKLPELIDTLATDDHALPEYQSIITALERLADLDEQDPAAVEERQREQVVAKRRLASLVAENRPVSRALRDTVREFNGRPGVPRSFDRLGELLGQQSYRLAFWRVAGEEINYRRFFAINELAAIRQEVPAVFASTHQLLLRLLAGRPAVGVRIDHPDGLWDPAGYFRDLQRAYLTVMAGEHGTVDLTPPPLYLVVEKILEHDESLPDNWAVHGTVGYEFATAVANLFVNPANRRAFDELYGSFIGERLKLADLIYEAKYLMMRTALMSEVNVLSQALNRISEDDRHTRDFTLYALRAALRETIANFPVYRTYIVGAEGTLRDQDRKVIQAAVTLAARRNPRIDRSVLDFLRDVLLTVATNDAGEPDNVDDRVEFTMKFQQLTGPVMAKGVEDTAFYQYNRLVSLNEVGGNPAQFGLSVAAFHREIQQRQRRWPHAMLTTSTHDTKRSEDVRARLHVLSEMPREWRAAINRWTRLNRQHKRRLDGWAAPGRNDEYLLYQTLLGTWSVDAGAAPGEEYVARIVAYMEKATREAQVHTSWLAPNEDYEAATAGFVRSILDPALSEPFLVDLTAFLGPIAYVGACNGLSQQTLKLTVPGVPDIYQGTELWDFSLVDPDNRRPVNYEERAAALATLAAPFNPDRLTNDPRDGRFKLLVTERLLRFRRERPDLFAFGDYQPLETGGTRAEHLCVFSRRCPDTDQGIIVVVPRLIAGLMKGSLEPPTGDIWDDTWISVPDWGDGGRFRHVITGERLDRDRAAPERLLASAALRAFPVAVWRTDGTHELDAT